MTELLFLLFWHTRSATPAQLPPPDAWEHANAVTNRIDPAVYPGIPRWLTAQLTRRQCSIPQSFSENRPHNIIHGFFNDGHVRDWAVLCSRQRVSTILVFWDEQAQKVAELASEPDAKFLQVVLGGEIGFSRVIAAATPATIRGYAREFADGALPPISHAGINDMFVRKGSTVWYWRLGKWLQLAGAD